MACPDNPIRSLTHVSCNIQFLQCKNTFFLSYKHQNHRKIIQYSDNFTIIYTFPRFFVAKLRKIWLIRHFGRWQTKNRRKFWRFQYFFVLLWSKSETKKGKTIMQTTANIENVSISIPLSDLSFLRTLSKKMGWKLKRPRKSGIERALDDIKAGRVYEAKSVDDLFEQLEQ